MKASDLIRLKEKLAKLSDTQKKQRDLYLKSIAEGKVFGPTVGYPSIDKLHLKYYDDNTILSDIPKMNVYEYLKKCNENHLDDVAIDYEFVSITYGELFKKIDEAANSLVALGIKEGDTITSCIPNFPEAIYLIYAAAKIGAKIDLIDPLTNGELLAKYCKNSNSKLMFTVDMLSKDAIADLEKCTYTKVITVSPMESLPIPNETEKAMTFNDDVISWSTFINSGKDVKSETVPYKEDMPLAILHTGGTTGIPKGVLLSHDNMNSLAYQVDNSPFNYQLQETVLELMPPFASYGICYGIYSHMCSGMRLRLIPTYDPTTIDKQIIDYKPNVITLTPAHVECLVKSPLIQDTDLSFIHAPVVAGDILAHKTEVKMNEILAKNGCEYPVAKGYGLTECCGGVSFSFNNEINELLSVGITLPKNSIAAFDINDSDKELPTGEIGEIAVLSSNSMLEYLNMPEETDKVIKTHSDGTRWLHTGDHGRVDENGLIYINGREKRMIIQHCGLKSNPFESEEVLIQHPLVKRAVVVGAKDPGHDQGELPVAYVEIDKENFDKIDSIKYDLQLLCEKKVTYYSVPVDYVFVDEYPETSRGKIDYRELARQYNEMANTRVITPQKQLKI